MKHICAFVGVFRVVVSDGGDAIDPIGEEQISVRVDEPPTIVDLFCPEKARRFYSFVQIASITRIVEIFCFVDFGPIAPRGECLRIEWLASGHLTSWPVTAQCG